MVVDIGRGLSLVLYKDDCQIGERKNVPVLNSERKVAMLTEEKKEYFKELLSQKLDELLKNGDQAVNDMNAFNEKLPDPSDRATAASERDVNLRILEREKGLIGKIKEALERMNNGTYGVCEECEEEISERRLEVRPVTTLCIECKKRQEAEEKVKGL